MPPPYDSVVSIGGQSLIDGLWRILGPALEGLTNPLPIAIPGFANAQMRISQLEPLIPGTPLPAAGAIRVLAKVEIVAEALLHVTTTTNSVNIALGQQNFTIDTLTGAVNLAATGANLSNVTFPTSAINLGTGTGTVNFPNAAPLSNVAGTGTLPLPNNLAVPGIPLPAVIPIAVDLTPRQPLELPATIVLTVESPSAATRFGLLFRLGSVTVGTVGGIDATLVASATARLQAAVNQVAAQLAIPGAPPPPTVNQADIATLLAPVTGLVATAFGDALAGLLAETGRLVYPAAGAGASCDVRVLPEAADAQLVVTTGGAYALQVGFNRAGSTDIPAFPPIGAGLECTVLVGNSLLLQMLCCLVERLPAFSLPVAAVTSTTDVNGTGHLSCCNFTGVTATFAGITIGGGGLSVCVDGVPGGLKTFSIIGSFTQGIPTTLPLVGTIATVAIGFTLPVVFDLQDASAVTNLRFLGTPAVTATVSPNIGALIAAGIIGFFLGGLIGTVGGGLVGAIVGAILGVLMPIAMVIVIFLLILACDAANYLIGNAVRTVLGGASLLRSPVAIPPGLFEAFGRLSPVTVTVDDLKADGVLHTPTSPWALLPRIGTTKRRPTKPGKPEKPDKPPRPTPPSPSPRPTPTPTPGPTPTPIPTPTPGPTPTPRRPTAAARSAKSAAASKRKPKS